ncbi:MAG: FtsH protease activity modulator HflK [Hyphomicrobiaceae bacterium]|nr:FtsH protease activity modulator HflK [Hyphomicrobiaceae bacterium]
MPWSNQSGGGGGWKSGGGGPWGQRPPGGGGGGGGNGPAPDLEEMLRKGQDRLRQAMPGGGGNKLIWMVAVLGVVVIWLMNSFYTVDAEQEGVVLRFGKFVRSTPPGLHFMIWPIETVELPKVQAENQLNFGVSSRGGSQEGLMLAGDQNIVDIKFTVLWKIADARKYLFNVRNPELLVRYVAESAMREVVGRTPAEQIRTQGRLEAQNQVRGLIQATLDRYNTGILITGVKLEKADPPPAVIDAFEEVQRAEQNQNQFIREAERYRNKVLGEARGESAKIVEDAKAYKARVVNEAEGEAQRFVSVYDEYSKAKDVTRKRLFLETLEDVYSKTPKVIIEQGQQGGSGVVPYLPLPEVAKRARAGEAQKTGRQ